MCVDYKSLNIGAAKDGFPILVMDELLDDLNGAKLFTKLDLQFGYHHIIMCPQDLGKMAFQTP